MKIDVIEHILFSELEDFLNQKVSDLEVDNNLQDESISTLETGVGDLENDLLSLDGRTSDLETHVNASNVDINGKVTHCCKQLNNLLWMQGCWFLVIFQELVGNVAELEETASALEEEIYNLRGNVTEVGDNVEGQLKIHSTTWIKHHKAFSICSYWSSLCCVFLVELTASVDNLQVATSELEDDVSGLEAADTGFEERIGTLEEDVNTLQNPGSEWTFWLCWNMSCPMILGKITLPQHAVASSAV